MTEQQAASIATSISPLGFVGVQAALHAAKDASFVPRRTIEQEFDLTGRVAVVSGGNRGLGLEMAEALCEAGAVVYCLDLPEEPGEEWKATRAYVARLANAGGGSSSVGGGEDPIVGTKVPESGTKKNAGAGRLEYARVDVTDQKAVWAVVERIAEKEQRLDVCIAAAGILQGADCLEYPAEEFEKVMRVNVNGVLYTAQAAGREMARLNTPGSIVLVASMSGSITNKDHPWVAYNTSKSAVLQMARSMACELGAKRIRVNSLSPGHIYTAMTAAFLDKYPELYHKWSSLNPLGRLGRPDELRGVALWLASDASTFCTGSDILVSGGHHAW